MIASLVAALCFSAGLVLLIGRPHGRLRLVHAALIVAAIGAAPVWRSLLAGYPDDSFFTLAPLAGAGLVLLSCLMIALIFVLSVAKSGWLDQRLVPGPAVWAIDLGFTLALGYLCLWIAPQAYYLYYLTVFDWLTLKSVIGAPPRPTEFLSLLLLTEPPSLSIHLQGVTIRALLILAALPALTAFAARFGRPALGGSTFVAHLALGPL